MSCVNYEQVRLIGRRYFTDDPAAINSPYMLQPGRMPIEYEGIVLNICLLGAIIGSLVIPPLADKYGRKRMFEISLWIIAIFSFLSAFSFASPQSGASGQVVVGSLCFWRAFLGIGVGGVYPLAASIMSEYSSRRSRGGYVSLVYSMQGIGQLLVCGVVAVASYGISYNWPGKPFPLSVSRVTDFPLALALAFVSSLLLIFLRCYHRSPS
jgi:MFS transporter, PHS family, inorganic phosphate transporter